MCGGALPTGGVSLRCWHGTSLPDIADFMGTRYILENLQERSVYPALCGCNTETCCIGVRFICSVVTPVVEKVFLKSL